MVADSDFEEIWNEIAQTLTTDGLRKWQTENADWMEEERRELELDDAELEVDCTLLDLLNEENGVFKSNELNRELIERCSKSVGCDARTSAAALTLVYFGLRKYQNDKKSADDNAVAKRRPKINLRRFGRLFTQRQGVKSARLLEKAYRYLFDNIENMVYEFCDTDDLGKIVKLLRPSASGKISGNADSIVGWKSGLRASGSPPVIPNVEPKREED